MYIYNTITIVHSDVLVEYEVLCYLELLVNIL